MRFRKISVITETARLTPALISLARQAQKSLPHKMALSSLLSGLIIHTVIILWFTTAPIRAEEKSLRFMRTIRQFLSARVKPLKRVKLLHEAAQPATQPVRTAILSFVSAAQVNRMR